MRFWGYSHGSDYENCPSVDVTQHCVIDTCQNFWRACHFLLLPKRLVLLDSCSLGCCKQLLTLQRHFDILKHWLTIYNLTRYNIRDDVNLQQYSCENLKPHIRTIRLCGITSHIRVIFLLKIIFVYSCF